MTSGSKVVEVLIGGVLAEKEKKKGRGGWPQEADGGRAGGVEGGSWMSSTVGEVAKVERCIGEKDGREVCGRREREKREREERRKM